MPKNMALMRLEIPASAALLDVEQWAGQALAADWRQNKGLTQSVGMQWLDSQASLGLWVPSYVEPAERNLLLNPAHPDYLRINWCAKRILLFLIPGCLYDSATHRDSEQLAKTSASVAIFSINHSAF